MKVGSLIIRVVGLNTRIIFSLSSSEVNSVIYFPGKYTVLHRAARLQDFDVSARSSFFSF